MRGAVSRRPPSISLPHSSVRRYLVPCELALRLLTKPCFRRPPPPPGLFLYAWKIGLITSAAALSAYFYEMYLRGICASDLLWASEDGFFDDDADEFKVREEGRVDGRGQARGNTSRAALIVPILPI